MLTAEADLLDFLALLLRSATADLGEPVLLTAEADLLDFLALLLRSAIADLGALPMHCSGWLCCGLSAVRRRMLRFFAAVAFVFHGAGQQIVTFGDESKVDFSVRPNQPC